ncbi:TenA family protein [Halonotius roseus]|uniref:Transcriptional regulator n=1 Tax=Halonotius roseus TaxID=2511997 RepID=A0A544QLA1_9EURY|nr:TenA family protein [Halonotius roseus]TQQ79380.1 transcriptional regulator [Halonotius roseus]
MSGDSFVDYAADRDEPRFTDWLRERSEPVWSDAVDHRFTQELGAGTLDDEVMAQYLLQDYAFVDTLVGVFGYAVGQAPTMTEKRRFVEFLDVITDDENDYFERSFDALDVPAERWQAPDRTAATESFIDLLLAAKAQGGYAETLAVLVPAEWIYLLWATREAGDRPEPFYFAEWIDLHANDGFVAFVEWLREQLDTIGPTLSARRQQRVARLFERTVDHEVAFFDAPYDQADER